MTEHRISDFAITEASVEALEAALTDVVKLHWPSIPALLRAPDIALDFCSQYVVNTRKKFDKWSEDELVAEYIRQMTGDKWKPVRLLAERPFRGSELTQRLILGVADQALRRADAPRMGQMRAHLVVLRTYFAAALKLTSGTQRPFDLHASHRKIASVQFPADRQELVATTRNLIVNHLKSGGLRQGETLVLGWRITLMAMAIAWRGACGIALARGENAVDLDTWRQALETVESGLLRDGQLAKALTHTSLIDDIATRFLMRRSATATLIPQVVPL